MSPPSASTDARVPHVPLGRLLLLLPFLQNRDLLLCWAITANFFFLKFLLSLFHLISAGFHLPSSLGGLFCVKHLVQMPQIIPVPLSDTESLPIGNFSFLCLKAKLFHPALRSSHSNLQFISDVDLIFNASSPAQRTALVTVRLCQRFKVFDKKIQMFCISLLSASVYNVTSY